LTGLLAAAMLLSRILLAGGLLVLLAGLLIALVLLGILVWARHFKYLIDAEKRERYAANHEELDYKLLIVPMPLSGWLPDGVIPLFATAERTMGERKSEKVLEEIGGPTPGMFLFGSIVSAWNLRNDDLAAQSEECIAFLA
jgi:hypothetical protein